ncbi:MAG TPA: hypothetical protein VH061_02615 [Solirubrobacteraceae bacterium]|jgi:hypothetical protein|nr:hypothetical protein [Solirubrobacteraceae bacterium]
MESSIRRLVFNLIGSLLLAGCGSSLIGCGATKQNTDAKRAVEKNVYLMLSDLERGHYVQACEAFTARSRFAISMGAANDRHESDSPCEDVFVMTGALKDLGLQQAGASLEAAATRAGLTRTIDLAPRAISRIYRGIAATDTAPIGVSVTVHDDRATLDGKVIAMRQNGAWRLEVNDVKPLPGDDEDAVQKESCEATSRTNYRRLCELLKAVRAGVILTGSRHRELKVLFPLLLRGSNAPILPGGQPTLPPQQ